MRSRSGFTILEIMIVVAIIGLLAAIALPGFMRARQESHRKAFVNDLRIAVDAFSYYAMTSGAYPPDGYPSSMPAGMDELLAKMDWADDTPIGGQWDWDNGQFGFRAGVSVYHPDIDDSEMAVIDRMIDDGNLNTGSFRRRSDGYIAIIER